MGAAEAGAADGAAAVVGAVDVAAVEAGETEVVEVEGAAVDPPPQPASARATTLAEVQKSRLNFTCCSLILGWVPDGEPSVESKGNRFGYPNT